MWKLLRRRKHPTCNQHDWKREALSRMCPADLADIGLKPADAERLTSG